MPSRTSVSIYTHFRLNLRLSKKTNRLKSFQFLIGSYCRIKRDLFYINLYFFNESRKSSCSNVPHQHQRQSISFQFTFPRIYCLCCHQVGLAKLRLIKMCGDGSHYEMLTILTGSETCTTNSGVLWQGMLTYETWLRGSLEKNFCCDRLFQKQ